jgi:hypothetical protein
MRAPAARDVTLFQDPEFQILLRELRYPPVRGLYGVRSRDATVPRNPGK